MNKFNRIIESSNDLKAFLEETCSLAQFKIEKINFSDQHQWHFQNGALSHKSGGFFNVVGIENIKSKNQQLIYYQPQSALTGLAIHNTGSQLLILLQARIEPGNTNISQFGPTIQSTSANYMRLHGGDKTSYVEFFRNFHPEVIPLGNSLQFDLGQRYFQKNKIHSYLELNNIIHTSKNMAWVSIDILKEALYNDNFLNTDLRSLVGIFDWDLYLENKSHNAHNPQSFFMQDYQDQPEKGEWRFTKLENLKGWSVQDDGIIDTSDSGIWVDMHNVYSANREVQNWQQPLLHCSTQGRIILLVRKKSNSFEFLLSFKSEFGISGGLAVFPTYVIYPGENSDGGSPINIDNYSVLAETVQSEEGGRFYKNENVYQVLLVDETIEIKPYQKWIAVDDFKSILKSSCNASLQLRCIASLVLNMLNPNVFG